MTKEEKKFIEKLEDINEEAGGLLGNDKHAKELLDIMSLIIARFKTYFNTYSSEK